MRKKTIHLRVLLTGLAMLPGVGEAELKNLHAPYPVVVQPAEGLSWPKGQSLPTFAAPASALDAIVVQDLSKDEQLTFSALQGQVNRKQPRILLLDARAGEGRDTWAKTLKLGIGTYFAPATRYDLLAKHAKEVTGVVLYDPAKSPHYRNLAGTVAAQKRALPVTAEVHARMKEKGIALEVVEDLTGLTFTTPVEIYGHLHAKYWPQADKRLIVSAKPHDERGGGDYHHTRDMAAATGAATVWLNTQDPAERDVLRKFFADMTAGEGIALGWYTTERSGIPTASEFGIGTMPADFFTSSTVFAGTDPRIQIPPVPKMPALENKAYIAIFISDGDNIQNTQHAIRMNWDRTANLRGKVPLSWTIAPGLVDIAPGILNYYYSSATANDCFVTGPSGMGYLMPVNTLEEPGAPVGDKLRDPVRMNGYARMTEAYVQRAGLRVMTIWDDASPMQRQSYEKHCRTLYGATVQNFKDVPSVASSVENGRLRFDKLKIPYAGSFEHIHGDITRNLRRWDGNSPLFLSYQADAWSRLRIDGIVALQEQLNREFPEKVRFVRADHYFNLHHEADGLPFNLCLAPSTTVTAGDGPAEAVTDGTPVTLWSAKDPAKRWLSFDFGAPRTLRRHVIRHAGEGGQDRKLNTKAYRVETSEDGKSWKSLGTHTGNTQNVTDIEFPPVRARHVKITVTDAGADATARIAEVEIYGTAK
jgi:hypothetical protein